MIDQTLQFIRNQLSEDDVLDLGLNDIITDNFHTLQSSPNREGVFISLVNIEEEKTLKNKPSYIRLNNQLKRIEPAVVLNLYVLFAFKLSQYNTSIIKLSQVISFFQQHKFFSFNPNTDTQFFDPPIDRLIFELHNMNFEQLNHIWSVLGGNHYPSVLYKVRIVKVQRNVQLDASEVTSIKMDSSIISS